MMSSTIPQTSADAKDLLLEDYRYRAAMMAESEKTGETRVNLFVVLMTFVCGALVGLVTSDKKLNAETEFLVVIGGLGALLVFGWLTLLRLIKRNRSTDECKHSLDLIRQIFKDRFDEAGVLAGYYPVNWPYSRNSRRAKDSSRSAWSMELRSLGGLAHLVAAINGILIGGLLSALLWYSGFKTALLLPAVAIVSFLAATAVQIAHVRRKEKTHRNELAALLPTHAGGVVVRQSNGRDEYLLVQNKSQEHWVLPKGKIEDGEGHGEAALREVKEEGGVSAQLLGVLGQWDYTVEETNSRKKQDVRLKVYLMAWERDTATKEQRSPTFLDLETAVVKAKHAETKAILTKAAQVMSNIRAHAQPVTKRGNP